MNRNLSLHPASAVLGLVFGVLVLLSMSQVPPLNARGINVQYGPDPRDMVQIREGTPYTVPAGKLFVPTALGKSNGFNSLIYLNVNSQTEVVGWGLYNTTGTTAFTSMAQVPLGFTVPAGSTITVTGGSGDGRAWGYLAPQ